MSAAEIVALAASISLLAGWRLYLVVFATGVAMKYGWVALPDQLQALDVLANNWIIGLAGVGALAEFFADKIAWVDSAWDAIHSFIRPLGGALLTRTSRLLKLASAAALIAVILVVLSLWLVLAARRALKRLLGRVGMQPKPGQTG